VRLREWRVKNLISRDYEKKRGMLKGVEPIDGFQINLLSEYKK
jgi:hypothetical protein